MSSHAIARHALRIARAPLAIVSVVAASSLSAADARAESPDTLTEESPRPDPVVRSWSYLEDPRLPAPMQAVILTRATYTDSTASVTRPFAANTGTPGGALEIGGEIGLLPHLSVVASAIGGEGQGGSTASRVGAMTGVRLSLLPAAWTASHLVASVGYVHDFDGANGGWARITGTQDLGRLRLGSSVHAEHLFGGGHDAADVMVTAGASFAVVTWARLGVEYVGQDLEESLSDEAEGGARHFAGPTVATTLLGDRVSLVGGPAFGLSPQSPRFLGRVGLAYSF